MRELDLQPCQPQPWRHSLTAADDTPRHIPDLVGRDFTADAPGQKLAGEITYMPTWQGWLFLTGHDGSRIFGVSPGQATG